MKFNSLLEIIIHQDKIQIIIQIVLPYETAKFKFIDCLTTIASDLVEGNNEMTHFYLKISRNYLPIILKL